MAIFEAPDAETHAIEAAGAAMVLLDITRQLNAQNPERPLAIHMGINSGTALVGSTRFEGIRGSRWTFTASGPTTNLAARLAGLAQAGQVLVGPETANRLGDRFRIELHSRARLKNMGEATDIYLIARGH